MTTGAENKVGKLLPPTILDTQEEAVSRAFQVLFPDDGDDLPDMTRITETPARMILPLVRLRIIREATNLRRKMPLIEVFVREFDRRMISRERRGRLEAISLMQGMVHQDGEEDASI